MFSRVKPDAGVVCESHGKARHPSCPSVVLPACLWTPSTALNPKEPSQRHLPLPHPSELALQLKFSVSQPSTDSQQRWATFKNFNIDRLNHHLSLPTHQRDSPPAACTIFHCLTGTFFFDTRFGRASSFDFCEHRSRLQFSASADPRINNRFFLPSGPPHDLASRRIPN